jgi:hypothetical protein
MNNKFRIKEKIQIDYGFTKNDSKFDENCLDVKDEIKFSYLEEVKEKRKNTKFRRIFKNFILKLFFVLMI